MRRTPSNSAVGIIKRPASCVCEPLLTRSDSAAWPSAPIRRRSDRHAERRARPADSKNESAGSRLGVWETNAARDFAPCLVPQETGNHRGVRWAEITDDAGNGIRVRQRAADAEKATLNAADAGSTLNVSLLPYSSAQIEEASHQWELADPSSTPLTHLRLLAGQMGVGGDDSWGSPVHEKYHIAANEPLRLDVDLELI